LIILAAFHVYRYVEQYTNPAFFGIAWWVPFLFGSAVVAIGYSHPFIDPLTRNVRRAYRVTTSIAELTWLLLAYLIAASPINSLAKTMLLILIYINFWLLAGRGWQNLVLSFVTAITGTLMEMTLVATGAFSYVQPDILGVPYWLPFVFGLTASPQADTESPSANTF
jgi:hypothetical protein